MLPSSLLDYIAQVWPGEHITFQSGLLSPPALVVVPRPGFIGVLWYPTSVAWHQIKWSLHKTWLWWADYSPSNRRVNEFYFWLQSGSKFTNLDFQIISCLSRPYPPTVHQEDMEYSQHWPILRWGCHKSMQVRDEQWLKALRFWKNGCAGVTATGLGWILNCITKFEHLQGKCI